MHEDHLDVNASLAAIAADAAAVFGGFMLATWLRFDSGWFTIPLGRPPEMYSTYAIGASIATLIYLFVYRSLGLFERPQLGSLTDKIPRIMRANGVGLLLTMSLAFIVKNRTPFSTLVLFVSFFTIMVIVLIERTALFFAEIEIARRTAPAKRILILGTGQVAAHLKKAVDNEPRLRSETVGFLRTDLQQPDTDIPAETILGTVEEFEAVAESENRIDQVILTDSKLSHEQVIHIILLCERNLIAFKLVPDIFRILTGSVDFHTIGDIPLLGVGQWPLDGFWNRAIKRLEDIAGAVVGLTLSAPLVLISAALIKRESPGPIFYRQKRCGHKGREFTLYKLRTMKENAEDQTGPVWTAENDPRRTQIGALLRRTNIDETPQFWNVLIGNMSLVGPRPERPHFVEQFKEDIARYMWRHVSKPGMTGWAQVNGLRGNSSIEERIKYDLYYLENWALAFDFKILVKTIFASENAY